MGKNESWSGEGIGRTAEKPNTAHGVNEATGVAVVYLATQASDVDINDVIERCGAICLAPYFLRDHAARYDFALMAQQKREQVELARSERNFLCSSRRATAVQIETQFCTF
jgi:hypothetical protein